MRNWISFPTGRGPLPQAPPTCPSRPSMSVNWARSGFFGPAAMHHKHAPPTGAAGRVAATACCFDLNAPARR